MVDARILEYLKNMHKADGHMCKGIKLRKVTAGGGGRKPKKQNIKILINHEAIVFEGQVF